MEELGNETGPAMPMSAEERAEEQKLIRRMQMMMNLIWRPRFQRLMRERFRIN